MNNEIKEMLELHIKHEIDLLPKNQQVVLDYITNLQQENDRLKEENNILKELNVCVGCENYYHKREIAGIQVVVSGETYNEYKGTLQDQISELENRIDKAVEYIKENAWYMNKDDEEILDRVGIEGLLDILNGNNNE